MIRRIPLQASGVSQEMGTQKTHNSTKGIHFVILVNFEYQTAPSPLGFGILVHLPSHAIVRQQPDDGGWDFPSPPFVICVFFDFHTFALSNFPTVFHLPFQLFSFSAFPFSSSHRPDRTKKSSRSTPGKTHEIPAPPWPASRP